MALPRGFEDSSDEEAMLVPGEDPVQQDEIVQAGRDYTFLHGEATQQMRLRKRPVGYVFLD